MLNQMRSVKQLLLHPIYVDVQRQAGDDAVAQHRARNVVIIALGLAGVCLTMLISALIRGAPIRIISLLLAGVALALVVGLLAVGGQVRIAAAGLVIGPLLLVASAASADGQLRSAPFFATLSLFIAGLTMRPRAVTLTFAGALAALAALGVTSAGVAQLPLPQGSQLINATILVGITALIATLGATSAAQSLRAMQARERQARQVEQALRESEERYRLIAENSSDLIALLDAGGSYLYASPSFAHELGHAPETLIGTNLHNLIHPEDLPAAISHWRQAALRGSAQASYRVAHADGGWRWLEARLTAAIRNEQRFIVLVARDVTEQRAIETQMQQAQKLEALGRLASGIAHDFNNLLVVINCGAELAAAELPADHPAQIDLDTVRQASRRAAGLTRQLLAFARRQVITPRLVHLGDVVQEVSRMLERLLGEQITLVTQVAPDVWPVWADPSQIEQVLMNMAVNARDAMPQGGTLSIAVANILHAPSDIGVGVAPTHSIRLTIADTGVGMSEEVRSHLFEPFYTTKAPDQGTGLGLATCYGIVTQIGGDITVSSSVGAGSTFTILLPRAVEPPDAEPSSQEQAAPRGGRETVLVVEDDPFVRALIGRVVRAHNYRALEAADADAALELARQHSDQIDLLVTDIGLPRLNGAALADELRRIIPSIKVLLISGYEEDALPTRERLPAGTAFLPKPFSPAVLGARLHEMLGEISTP